MSARNPQGLVATRLCPGGITAHPSAMNEPVLLAVCIEEVLADLLERNQKTED